MKGQLCEKCAFEPAPPCCTACPLPGDALFNAGPVTDAAAQSPPLRFKLATGFWQRLRGLLGRKANWLGEDEVLVLSPCNSIHTLGMRHSIDVAFVDGTGKVLKAEQDIKPGMRLSCEGAKFAIERFSLENTASCSSGERVVNACNWLSEGEIMVLCTLK